MLVGVVAVVLALMKAPTLAKSPLAVSATTKVFNVPLASMCKRQTVELVEIDPMIPLAVLPDARSEALISKALLAPKVTRALPLSALPLTSTAVIVKSLLMANGFAIRSLPAQLAPLGLEKGG